MSLLRLNLALLLFSACASHERPEETADAGRTERDAARPARDGGDAPDSFLPDAGSSTASCAPDDASADPCPAFLCDGPPSWHWNGDACIAIDCGACVGSDCERASRSSADCEAAHATCEPQLCRSSGGSWLWWAEECSPYVCGMPQPRPCIVGRPVCDCGANAIFDPELGCVPAECPPPPFDRASQCEGSGGVWSPICCDTVCGALCPEPCTALACNCGPGREFLTDRGCVETTRCHERSFGESCDGQSRCLGGAVCCEECTGAGCSGTPTCAAPVCDDDECTDLCGNRCDSP
jgi:hypothetical protein